MSKSTSFDTSIIRWSEDKYRRYRVDTIGPAWQRIFPKMPWWVEQFSNIDDLMSLIDRAISGAGLPVVLVTSYFENELKLEISKNKMSWKLLHIVGNERSHLPAFMFDVRGLHYPSPFFIEYSKVKDMFDSGTMMRMDSETSVESSMDVFERASSIADCLNFTSDELMYRVWVDDALYQVMPCVKFSVKNSGSCSFSIQPEWGPADLVIGYLLYAHSHYGTHIRSWLLCYKLERFDLYWSIMNWITVGCKTMLIEKVDGELLHTLSIFGESKVVVIPLSQIHLMAVIARVHEILCVYHFSSDWTDFREMKSIKRFRDIGTEMFHHILGGHGEDLRDSTPLGYLGEVTERFPLIVQDKHLQARLELMTQALEQEAAVLEQKKREEDLLWQK